MTAPLFDVYVVGTADRSLRAPGAQLKLAATLATTFRVPAAQAAEALAGGHCRVGERLGRDQAETLMKTLATMGVVGALQPHGVPLGTRGPSTERAAVSGDGRITLKSVDARETLSVLDVSEAVEFATPGAGAHTGVRGPELVRCTVHGLMYNRRQASGCVRCLEAARDEARKVEQHIEREGSRAVRARLGRIASPVRAAFFGLGVALVIGFAPAAYYARVVAAADLRALRSQQAELSRASATPEVLHRFDAIDAEVNRLYRRGAGRTLALWITISAISGFGWAAAVRRLGSGQRGSG